MLLLNEEMIDINFSAIIIKKVYCIEQTAECELPFQFQAAFYNSSTSSVPTALAAKVSATEPRHLLSSEITQATREESWPHTGCKTQNLKIFERPS